MKHTIPFSIAAAALLAVVPARAEDLSGALKEAGKAAVDLGKEAVDVGREAVGEVADAAAKVGREFRGFFNRWDDDADGRLTRAELDSEFPKLKKDNDRVFARIDADKDGFITPDEIEVYVRENPKDPWVLKVKDHMKERPAAE